ncbi:MAG: DUF4240 domain-containing protein [Planctomycetales bacterium]
MDVSRFWLLIADSLSKSEGDPEKQRDVLVQALTRRDESELVDFERHYFDLIARAHRWNLADAIRLISDGCSDDSFYYFCDFLVSKGERVYERTLADPESLLDDALDEEGMWPYGEMQFNQAGADAYRIQAGDPDAELHCDYDWPDLMPGEGIDCEDDSIVKEVFPRIWAHLKKYNRSP